MNLLEFNSHYQKLLDEVRTEDLRTIKVFLTKSSGDVIWNLSQYAFNTSSNLENDQASL